MSSQASGAKRRLLGVDGFGNRFANSNTLLNKSGFAANMGPRRRGDPTIAFRWALCAPFFARQRADEDG